MTERREDSVEVRILLRIVLGLFGGLFVAVASCVALWSYTDMNGGGDALAMLVGLLFGAPLVAYGAFARSAAVRVAAWAIAGAGVGNTVMACAASGLSVGTVLTPSGIVMALVGAVLGYRTVLPESTRIHGR